jgi:hypothetical protein
VIGDTGGNQPTDQIACNIASDIGRECTASVRGTTFFTQISKRQGKG